MSLLDALCYFDWISPSLQFGSAAAGYRPMDIYMVGSGMTGAEVARILRAHGVKVGPGPMVGESSILITVDNPEMAQRILDRYGIGDGTPPVSRVAVVEKKVSLPQAARPAMTRAEIPRCAYCGTPGKSMPCPQCGGNYYEHE